MKIFRLSAAAVLLLTVIGSTGCEGVRRVPYRTAVDDYYNATRRAYLLPDVSASAPSHEN